MIFPVWIRLSAGLVAIATAISSAEFIAIHSEFKDGAFASYIMGSRPLTLRLRFLYETRKTIFNSNIAITIVSVRLFASIFLCLSAVTGVVSLPALVLVAASGLFISYRNLVGGDGSDQMSNITALALIPSIMYVACSRSQVICAYFIALQSVMSYCIAGIAKSVSVDWRSGSCLIPILKTRAYGHQLVAERLSRHSIIGVLCSWGIIIFEIGFPVVLLGYPQITFLYLVLGCIFHIFNAFFMGLNCFLWAFIATYPAILFSVGLIR